MELIMHLRSHAKVQSFAVQINDDIYLQIVFLNAKKTVEITIANTYFA